MQIAEVRKAVAAGSLESLLVDLYGRGEYQRQRERYLSLIDKFEEKFGEGDIRIISSPGRTELAGNHTDHNHGAVLAASIQLDSLAVVSRSDDKAVEICSEGFSRVFTADLDNLHTEPENEDSTSALLRGILSIFRERGLSIGGFRAYMASDVLIGSGLSSSASIEILIGKILSVLYNGDSVGPVDLAIIGQKAENVFLKKPCGLMDQVACAYGGIVSIDFADPASPQIEAISYSFGDNGYNLLVIDTGGDHSDLTDDYAAIPAEMKSVAASFGKDVCRHIDKEEFFRKIPELSTTVGDRAVLRVLHYLRENDRVREMIGALKEDRIESYLKGVRESGDSSFKYLQNVFTSRHVATQKVSLAIALTEAFDSFRGAVRVHGGGFAGTVQVYVENSRFEEYRAYIEQFFGIKSVTPLKIRQRGALVVL